MLNILLSLACLVGQFSAPALTAGKSSGRNDVGVKAILEPGPYVAAGSRLQPSVEIINSGEETEKYFDVRFRIGRLYDEVRTVDSVKPGLSVRVLFPEWTALAGSFIASCSTMLARDSNPANDTASRAFTAVRPLRLNVGNDQSATMLRKQTRDFLFSVELLGDTGALVSLAEVPVPSGWNVSLRDSTGRHEIKSLGRLDAGQRKYFRLRLTSPDTFPVGKSAPEPVTLAARAYCTADGSVADEAQLQVLPVPDEPAVHNFPNPFHAGTVFHLNLPFDGIVSLTVYNRAAERVATVLSRENVTAGYRFFSWPGRNDAGEPVAPGTYQYVLEYSSQGNTTRLVRKTVKTAPR